MKFKPVLLFFILTVLFLSCEDRIFLEKTPDIIYKDGKYLFDPADYDFDKVLLSRDSLMIELCSCRENESVLPVFFNTENGYYDMFVVRGIDTVYSDQTYIGKTDQECLNITALDVKQGDCFIIEPSDGKSSVIDGGYGTLGVEFWQDSGNATLLNYLTENNITGLKYMIETHHDADHYGGLFDVKADSSISFEKYLTFNDSLPVFGDTLYFSESVKAVMLHYGDSTSTNENDKSVSFKMSYFDFEMIFTGDIEEDTESAILSRNLLDPSEDYEILKVAHHGSSSSSTQEFLNAVMPLYSLISVGAGNDYGHPRTEVLERLKSIKSNILRTDLNSTVRIFTDGHSFQVLYKK